MTEVSAADLLAGPTEARLARTISDRLSQELVIALVGPLGSGVSTAAGLIYDILKNDYHYDVRPIIKPSDIIKAEAFRVGFSIVPGQPINEYIDLMQTAGNKLRERFGGDYLAEKIVEKIYKDRLSAGGYGDNDALIPMRRAFIIDSLKNTEELELLRQIYGETFCLFGVFAPDNMRKERLVDNGADAGAMPSLMDRDQGELSTFGQKTRKLFVNADFFICNDRKPLDLRSRIQRFLSLLFDTQIHTPTKSESAMYEATSASAKSACMSRQVGAAIISESGELISIGWNDVPKFKGGLYIEDDQSAYDEKKSAFVDRDHRCFKWSTKVCHNEKRRNDIVDSVIRKIASSGLLKQGKKDSDIRRALEGTTIDSLIEFSRSIHAEMEAILAVAREGKHSLVGATLYTNTYPCHNCARHIVASGIRHVYYIEPYLKSLAKELHRDAISEDPDEVDKVVFRQYEGVAPRNYLRLFRMNADRKRNGTLSRQSPMSALPIFRIPLDSQTEYEAKVVAELSEKEHV